MKFQIHPSRQAECATGADIQPTFEVARLGRYVLPVDLVEKPGQAEALEQQEQAILASASSAEGYLGSGVLRGTIGDTDYVNAVLHFAGTVRANAPD